MTSYHLGRDFVEPIEIKDKHASVSHNHATITVDGDKWVLSDNDSTNGTYIEEDGVFRRVRNMTITGQAESTVHMLNWAIRSVKFLGVEFDQSEDEEVSVSDTTHL